MVLPSCKLTLRCGKSTICFCDSFHIWKPWLFHIQLFVYPRVIPIKFPLIPEVYPKYIPKVSIASFPKTSSSPTAATRASTGKSQVLCPYARRTLAPWRLPYGWKPYGWWWNQSKYHVVDHIPTLCPIHIWDTVTNHGDVPPISGHVMKQT